MKELNDNVVCPKCDREWPKGCEQAICVYWHKECIVCRFRDSSNIGTDEELDLITAEYKGAKK